MAGYNVTKCNDKATLYKDLTKFCTSLHLLRSALALCTEQCGSAENLRCYIAFALLQDALGVDAFNVSSEALTAEALLDAYRSGDESAIRNVISSKHIFMDLDNQVRYCLV